MDTNIERENSGNFYLRNDSDMRNHANHLRNSIVFDDDFELTWDPNEKNDEPEKESRRKSMLEFYDNEIKTLEMTQSPSLNKLSSMLDQSCKIADKNARIMNSKSESNIDKISQANKNIKVDVDFEMKNTATSSKVENNNNDAVSLTTSRAISPTQDIVRSALQPIQHHTYKHNNKPSQYSRHSSNNKSKHSNSKPENIDNEEQFPHSRSEKLISTNKTLTSKSIPNKTTNRKRSATTGRMLPPTNNNNYSATTRTPITSSNINSNNDNSSKRGSGLFSFFKGAFSKSTSSTNIQDNNTTFNNRQKLTKNDTNENQKSKRHSTYIPSSKSSNDFQRSDKNSKDFKAKSKRHSINIDDSLKTSYITQEKIENKKRVSIDNTETKTNSSKDLRTKKKISVDKIIRNSTETESKKNISNDDKTYSTMKTNPAKRKSMDRSESNKTSSTAEENKNPVKRKSLDKCSQKKNISHGTKETSMKAENTLIISSTKKSKNTNNHLNETPNKITEDTNKVPILPNKELASGEYTETGKNNIIAEDIKPVNIANDSKIPNLLSKPLLSNQSQNDDINTENILKSPTLNTRIELENESMSTPISANNSNEKHIDLESSIREIRKSNFYALSDDYQYNTPIRDKSFENNLKYLSDRSGSSIKRKATPLAMDLALNNNSFRSLTKDTSADSSFYSAEESQEEKEENNDSNHNVENSEITNDSKPLVQEETQNILPEVIEELPEENIRDSVEEIKLEAPEKIPIVPQLPPLPDLSISLPSFALGTQAESIKKQIFNQVETTEMSETSTFGSFEEKLNAIIIDSEDNSSIKSTLDNSRTNAEGQSTAVNIPQNSFVVNSSSLIEDSDVFYEVRGDTSNSPISLHSFKIEEDIGHISTAGVQLRDQSHFNVYMPDYHGNRPISMSFKGLHVSQLGLTDIDSITMHTQESIKIQIAQKVTEQPTSIGRVRFAPEVIIYDTYDGEEYDRTPDAATCNELTPILAQTIKIELNVFKDSMDIHEESKHYTHYY